MNYQLFQIMNIVMLLLLLIVILPLIIASPVDEKSSINNNITTSLWEVPWFKVTTKFKITNENGPRHLTTVAHCRRQESGSGIMIQDFGLQRIKAGHSWTLSFRHRAFPAYSGNIYCDFRWKGFNLANKFVWPMVFGATDIILKPDYHHKSCPIIYTGFAAYSCLLK
ncbi:hypothetical protein ACFE04_029514 [Oxalis oulophora]